MIEMIITRGLPASGKSTAAKKWVEAGAGHRARVGRDPLRLMLHGGYLGTADQERQVTTAQRATMAALLATGVSVIVDDTNLHEHYACELRAIADAAGVVFEVWDFTDVPLEVCIRRDAARTEGRVGAEVIRDMHRKHLQGKRLPLPFPQPTATA